MTTLQDIQCKHGHVINCKQCDDELYAAMYQAGVEYCIQREQLIIDTILKGSHEHKPGTRKESNKPPIIACKRKYSILFVHRD